MARTTLKLVPFSTATAKLDLSAGTVSVPLSGIQLRKGEDARKLNAAHVVTLAESIAALGILEPVVIDLEGHLLAGGHRLAALQLLAEGDGQARRTLFLARIDGGSETAPTEEAATAKKSPPKSELTTLADRIEGIDTTAFHDKYKKGKVPVVAVDTSASAGPDLDIAVEAAENSVRRQYSREEIMALGERLRLAGFTSRVGRPAQGEKSARPVLEALLGVSGRHLNRLIGVDQPKPKSEWKKAVAALRRAAKRVEEATKGKKSEDEQELFDLALKIGAVQESK